MPMRHVPRPPPPVERFQHERESDLVGERAWRRGAEATTRSRAVPSPACRRARFSWDLSRARRTVDSLIPASPSASTPGPRVPATSRGRRPSARSAPCRPASLRAAAMNCAGSWASFTTARSRKTSAAFGFGGSSAIPSKTTPSTCPTARAAQALPGRAGGHKNDVPPVVGVATGSPRVSLARDQAPRFKLRLTGRFVVQHVLNQVPTAGLDVPCGERLDAVKRPVRAFEGQQRIRPVRGRLHPVEVLERVVGGCRDR